MQDTRLEIPDCPPHAVATLRAELGIGDTLAQTLVRRGMEEPARARAWLAADERHEPEAFAGIEHALEPIIAHVAAGRRITVHGDYDVDGVCSTALLVDSLRRLGAQVDWHIPDRAAGYGLRQSTVRELARRGTSLIITVDCGITAVEEVALAQDLGIEVVISDHHAAREDGILPRAPLVHPALCRYPCTQLCGAAVAHKLACALWSASGRDPRELQSDLDLVALASIADVVELTGENRSLVRAGLRALATTRRPGLRALIEVAGLDPARLDARGVAFGLAPRINAAGRLYDAAPALELLLTTRAARGAELAAALDRCNRERREVEQRMLHDAQAQLEQLGPMPAYVLAGEGWHPGVVGIVASRVVEATNRPAVLVALDGQTGKGSGRGIPGFDLLGALGACAGHLGRYGGHQAACGLELDRERLPAFRAAFAEHAASVLSGMDLAPTEHVDAIVSVRDLGLPLAEELERLAPHGRGNPTVTLLVRDARVAEVRGMGQGKHSRFRVIGDGAHASAVSFGTGSRLPIADGELVDATFRLEVNEWRGICEPRLVLRHIAAAERALAQAAGEPASASQPLQLALAVP